MDDKILLKTAPQFDVHHVSDHKEVNHICNDLFLEVLEMRKAKGGRIRKQKDYREHLKRLVLDLLVAYKLRVNPYRSISKNKSDYQSPSESRYSKLFLTYDLLIGCLDDLVALGYIEEKKGYSFPNDAKRTRIKATNKLVAMFEDPKYEFATLIKNKGILNAVKRGSSAKLEETIFLKDASKNLMPYEDTAETNLMRANLVTINNAIETAYIILDITDEQYRTLAKQLNERWDENQKIGVNFSNKHLHRVFNNGTFTNGGRFYGGWWINLPKDYRKYIRINHKDTVEVDYSAHHIRMLYAEKDIELSAHDDPYQIDVTDRDTAKAAMLLILNNPDKEKAINTMRNQGIKKAKVVCEELEKKHHLIKDKFYQVEANSLMNKDSKVAEQIILRMLEIGLVVLPVHDSFIVNANHEELLMNVMEEEFFKEFRKTTFVKSKEMREQQEAIYNDDLSMNIQSTFDLMINNESNKLIIREIWGYGAP